MKVEPSLDSGVMKGRERRIETVNSRQIDSDRESQKVNETFISVTGTRYYYFYVHQ